MVTRTSRFCLAFLVGCIALIGQTTTSLHGTVMDSQGAVIPDAVVTLTDPAGGTIRKFVSDKVGQYQFQQVPPGKYTVQVDMPGFASLVKNGLVLEVNTPATLDCTLQIGTVGTVVAVEADASSVNTVDASVGNAFTQKQIRQLPLQTRNVVELLSIQPGVTQTGEVLGARRDQNNITLDGVDVNQNQNSGLQALNSTADNNNNNGNNGAAGQINVTAGFNAALPVPLDSVQEFRVTVGGQGADEGRSSGGQVTLVTKSGSNQLHGSFYEYNRNTDLTANDWFNNQAGVGRTPLVRNQFGASLGGPVIKNRIFFFGNWERRIDASGASATRTVPSDSLRQGNVLVQLTNGTTQTLTPTDLAALDPLHLGFNPAMKAYFATLPAGNDPTLGDDHGLNFTGLRFNAPFQEDDSAYVAKMDFNIDQARKHTLSVRGTLAGDAQTNTVAQFPGGSPISQLLNNSRGISAAYTWVVKPNLINVFNYGLTRYSVAQSGVLGTELDFQSLSGPETYTRPQIQQIPTHNFADNLTWNKGSHTITTGVNFRFIQNNLTSYQNSFPAYSFSRNTLLGLGGDASLFVTSYLQTKLNDPSVALADPRNLERALGDAFGLINQYDVTYNFGRDGKALAIGAPLVRGFATNEYEGYVQDSWRIRRDLTLTMGLRYSNFSVPYETHGVEVATTVGLDKYFAERVGAAAAGIPNNQLPDASLTYQLAGAKNGKPSWYGRDTNNFGPRFAFAYAPTGGGDSLWSKIFGKGSVIRGGVAMVYDRYGSDMITFVDSSTTGSPGLANSATQPNNTNFTTSPRFSSVNSLPALPAPVGGAFPFTPPTITGGFDNGVGIDPGLVAPYSFVLNLNYARELPGKMTLELGYAGRLSRKNLVQQDVNQPLTNFKDPKSGQTWKQAAGILRKLYDSGITPDMVKANPGLIPNIAFFEDEFPALKTAYIKNPDTYINGSATANYFYTVYATNAGSDEDGLNQLDRARTDPQFPNCVSVTGCNTFYPLQSAGLSMWSNAGFANYHAGTVSLRRALSGSFAFDFNYTLSHSIDNSSGAESGASTSGAVLQDAFNPSAFRGSSDFDARHNITMDLLYELPVGKGKRFLGGSSRLMDEIVGGWQLSVIGRYHSGLPTTITDGGVYPVNYEVSALAIPAPGASIATHPGIDNNGLPSLFRNTSASGNFIESYPGETGTRAIIRLPGYTNFDMALAKSFAMPWEGHHLQFRMEAFNAFNLVNFYSPNLDLSNPDVFGELTRAQPARVVQLSLRYEF